MSLNIWAVLSATIVAYLAGALWYSPFGFLRHWSRETEIPVDAEPTNPVRVYGLTFLSTLISTLVLSWLIGPTPTLTDALTTGLLVGACLVSASLGINYQFGKQSLTLWIIDSGFHCLRFLLIALILAIWPIG